MIMTKQKFSEWNEAGNSLVKSELCLASPLELNADFNW